MYGAKVWRAGTGCAFSWVGDWYFVMENSSFVCICVYAVLGNWFALAPRLHICLHILPSLGWAVIHCVTGLMMLLPRVAMLGVLLWILGECAQFGRGASAG